MNKLFGLVFILTFLLTCSDRFWGWSVIGIVAMFLIVPYTTPELWGKKKDKE